MKNAGHLEVGPNLRLRSPALSMTGLGLMEANGSFFQTRPGKSHTNKFFLNALVTHRAHHKCEVPFQEVVDRRQSPQANPPRVTFSS